MGIPGEWAHNLKVTGSNPVPATKSRRVTNRLQAALRGGFCVSKTRGSTVEARRREVLRGDAQPKTTLSAHSRRSGTELGPSGAAPDQPFIVVAAAARGHLTGLGLAGKPTTFPKGARRVATNMDRNDHSFLQSLAQNVAAEEQEGSPDYECGTLSPVTLRCQ
jgi:hypothetical protein